MLECKCCEALKKHNEYLQGLLDRTMNLIAPKPEETIAPAIKAENSEDTGVIRLGEG